MTRPQRIGLATALLVLALDQASKLWLLFGLVLPLREPIRLGPFLDLIVVWNRGISYGLFQQHTELGRWLLLAVSILAAAGLSLWMWRAGVALLCASLGLIIGGALGNAVDRLAYGAVFDFVHAHAFGYSWYVFNIADAAIVAGVAGLIYDAVVGERGRRRHAA